MSGSDLSVYDEDEDCETEKRQSTQSARLYDDVRRHPKEEAAKRGENLLSADSGLDGSSSGWTTDRRDDDQVVGRRGVAQTTNKTSWLNSNHFMYADLETVKPRFSPKHSHFHDPDSRLAAFTTFGPYIGAEAEDSLEHLDG